MIVLERITRLGQAELRPRSLTCFYNNNFNMSKLEFLFIPIFCLLIQRALFISSKELTNCG